MGCNSSSVEHGKVDLLAPTNIGPYSIKNRLVMAAMTRLRADEHGVPTDVMVKYYSERAADAGIVLTECCPVSKVGNSFPGAGGIYNKEQMVGWKKVTDAVHTVNGKIFCQMYHCGRAVSENPIGPSAIANRYGDKYPQPKEMTTEDIKEAINSFIESAKLLKSESGFDGIELHAANGYLIDEFLRDGSNKRTDQYGGSIENRSRFLLEILDGVINVFGANRVGVKLSPIGRFNDMFDSNPKALLQYLLPELDKRRICFVEICKEESMEDKLWDIKGKDQIPDMYSLCKPLLHHVALIANSGFKDYESANNLIKEKKADLISFGTLYISNPDLSDRFKNGNELAMPDFQFAYYGGEKGYCDYPKFEKKN